jgi:pimeloyl-ACP methyl ester carboxylesterase
MPRSRVLVGVITTLTVFAVLAAAPGGALGARFSRAQIVERRVRFNVENTNRSKLPCPSDGQTYVDRGWLVAPRPLLRREHRDVTYYLHGSSGDLWHTTELPRHDHLVQMARRGHLSVATDFIGYGRSSVPDGSGICLGSYADMADQEMRALGSGAYRAGGQPGPAFERVVLAGQSAGGLLAQLTAYSFDTADALIVIAAHDQGFATPFAVQVARSEAPLCPDGGKAKYDDGSGAGGYAHVFESAETFSGLVTYDASPRAVRFLEQHRERDACGALESTPAVVAADHANLGSVHVPVLLVYSEEDEIFPYSGSASQKDEYSGSDDVTSISLPGTGHTPWMERRARPFWRRLSAWMNQRGF